MVYICKHWLSDISTSRRISLKVKRHSREILYVSSGYLIEWESTAVCLPRLTYIINLF